MRVPPPETSRHDRYMLQLSECKACLSTKLDIHATQASTFGRTLGDGDLVSMTATCRVCGFRFEVPTAGEVFR